MSFVERVSMFLIDHVAPRLPAGRSPWPVPMPEELERQAREELEARIAMGRPGPEEYVRTRPVPAWLRPQPRPSRPLEAVRVRLDVLADAAEVPTAPAPERTGTRVGPN